MIRFLDAKSKNYQTKLINFLDLRRSGKNIDTTIVKRILKDVKANKNKALLKYEKKFSNNNSIKIKDNELKTSIKSLDKKIKHSIDLAYNRILNFHKKQLKKNIFYKDKYNNKLSYKYLPLQSVGIYVPANLPSTLLMNSIPAKIAGVKRIVLANPKLNGKLNPAVLYAAQKVGINEIYSMGGAQAIASLAYIQKVNKIVGPGNIFVAAAKKELFGQVGIESMVAGPSEITVVADKSSNVKWVAADLIGQAEHDINAQCILISKIKGLIDKVQKELKIQLQSLPRKKIASVSLKKNGLLIFANSDKKISDIVNIIAPEHLELSVDKYKSILKNVKNAGSICTGKYSAMAVTDYCAGSNHTLPTHSSAKFFSGLSVFDFIKRHSLIKISKTGIERLGPSVINLARYENLEGHAKSVEIRLNKYKRNK